MEVAIFAGPCSAGQQLDDGAAVWGTPDAGRRMPAWGTPDGAAGWGWDLGLSRLGEGRTAASGWEETRDKVDKVGLGQL